jgi:hypothetical protein
MKLNVLGEIKRNQMFRDGIVKYKSIKKMIKNNNKKTMTKFDIKIK